MFERYTDECKRAIFVAQQIAIYKGAQELEPAHLLIGLMAQKGCRANRIFRLRELLPDDAHVPADRGRWTFVKGRTIPLGADGKRAVADSAREARELGVFCFLALAWYPLDGPQWNEIKSRLAADSHYFEKLIRVHLLENVHRTTLRLKPDPEAGRRFDEDEKARLANIRESLSESQIAELVETTKSLKLRQETPDSPKALQAEGQLRRVEHLEDDDFMTARGQRDQVGLEPFDRCQEIRDQDHQPAFANDLDDAPEGSGQVGGLTGRRFFQRQHQVPQMAGAMAGRQVIPDAFIEREQSHGVALQMQEIGKRRGERVIGRHGPCVPS